MRAAARISCLVVALAACSAPQRLDSTPRQVHREILAMGTKIGITLVVRNPAEEARAQGAIDDAQQALRDFGRRWWAWGDGELAQINRTLAVGGVAGIPESMRPLFSRATQLRDATQGRFEPRIGALVKLWGFDDVAHLRAAPPSEAEVRRAHRALQKAPAYDGGDRYGPARGVAWDFGAIAKGWIVDQVLDRLAAAGFRDSMVDAGGNLATRGDAGGRAWHVAIRDPRSSAEQPSFIAELDTRDEAVNTHADDQRFFEFQGERYGHILDPQTGRPARGLLSVTVVHRNGALADAAGAALFVAGPRHWRALARKLDLDQVLVLDAQGGVFITPRLSQRVKISAGTATRVALY